MEAKHLVTLGILEKIVKADHRTNTKRSNSMDLLLDLFSRYKKILHRNGLSSFVKDNQKVVVVHVFLDIYFILNYRFESDSYVSQHGLGKKLTCFLAHAVKLTEVFQLVRLGLPSLRRLEEDTTRSVNGEDGSSILLSNPGPTKPGTDSKNDGGSSGNKDKLVPVCLWEPKERRASVIWY